MAGTEASARLKAPESAVPAPPLSAHAAGSAQAPSADLDALDRAAEGIRPSWHGASSHPPASGLVEAAVPDMLRASPSALASPRPTAVGYAFEPAPTAPSPDSTHPMDALRVDELVPGLVPTTLGQFSNHPTVQRIRNWVLVRPRAVLAGGAALCVLLLIALWPSAPNHVPPPLPAGPKLALAPATKPAPGDLPAPAQPTEAASRAQEPPAQAAEAAPPPAPLSKEAAARNARNKRREAARNNALKAPVSGQRPEPRAATKPEPRPLTKKAPEPTKASKARALLAPNPYR